jgi:NAD(P)-dependent dehydrogenase (short-subunit alcohol dehydrogenase family)
MLTQDPEAVADLIAERNARLQAEQADQRDVREAALEKAAALEKEIDNLVNLAASGKAPARVLEGIAAREREVAVLKATPAPPPVFDRAAFFKQFKGTWSILQPGSAQQLRAALRKLDVDSVVPYPDGKGGWTFEATADLAGLAPNVALGERAG